MQFGPLMIDFRCKIALGQMQQVTDVNGATDVLNPDGSMTFFRGAYMPCGATSAAGSPSAAITGFHRTQIFTKRWRVEVITSAHGRRHAQHGSSRARGGRVEAALPDANVLAASLAPLRIHMCWITERLVERNCLSDQATHYRSFKFVAVMQFNGGHFILAAGLEAVLNLSQALAAPETEQDTPFLCSNEKDGAVECVDQVPPLNALLEVRKKTLCTQQSVSFQALPERNFRVRRCGRFGIDTHA